MMSFLKVKRQLLLIIVFCSMVALPTQAQTGKLQSGIVYYFTKYMDWPAAKKSGDFNIYVVGNDDITPFLKSMAAEKQVVGSQKLTIKEVSSINEVKGAHIVFLGKSKQGEFSNAKSMAQSSNFLLVTASEGLGAKGAGCNFVVRDGKPAYEINESVINSCGLKTSARLLALGIAVSSS